MSAQSTTITLPTPTSSSVSVQITYEVLTPFHNQRHRIVKRGKNKGKERSSQQVENDDSALRQFLKDLNPPKSKPDLIGDEFSKDFEKLLNNHLKNVKENYKNRKESKGERVDEKSVKENVNNRKSKLKAWHESYRAMLACQHLPDGFKASLKLLIDDYIRNHQNITIYAIAKKCGIPDKTLAEWAYGASNPSPAAKNKIAALEKFFNLPASILWNKLPYRADKSNLKSQATTHRKLLALKAKDKYILPEFPPAVQEEWDGLVKLYTKKSEIEDPAAAIDEGLELNDDESSERKEDVIWRKRLDGINVTERIKNLLARTFFGFLLRDLSDPYDQELINIAIEAVKKHRRAKGKEIDRGANRGGKKNSGTWLTSHQIDEKRGKRFNEEELSLALLGDARLTYPYIQWKRARTGEVFYNSFVKSHLQFCSQLVHPNTGYLTKHPEFGKRLPAKIDDEREWIEWCKSSHRKFNTYLRKLEFGQSRDPFEPIEEYIDLEHPINVLEDMADLMEADLPSFEFDEVTRATAYRDLLLIKFLTVVPLREYNFSIMTTFHLYQKKDGTWHVRFSKEEFKNERGAARNDDYDVPLPRSLWPYIEEYLNVHRPILYKALWKSIHHLEIDDQVMRKIMDENCHHVFLPHPNKIKLLSRIRSVNGKGRLQLIDEIKKRRASGENLPTVTENDLKPFVDKIREMRQLLDFNMNEGSIHERVFKLTQLYIPNCVGFGPHAARHLVGTELAKNEPHGIDIAANVLHITRKMAEAHYARVRPKDVVQRWINYYERHKERRKLESVNARGGRTV